MFHSYIRLVRIFAMHLTLDYNATATAQPSAKTPATMLISRRAPELGGTTGPVGWLPPLPPDSPPEPPLPPLPPEPPEPPPPEPPLPPLPPLPQLEPVEPVAQAQTEEAPVITASRDAAGHAVATQGTRI